MAEVFDTLGKTDRATELRVVSTRSGAPKKFSGQLLTAKHRQKFSFSRQTHSNY
jgi:hypothetical protein